MKKKLALLLSTVLVMSSVLVGCGGSNEAAQEETNNETTTQTTEGETTEDTVAEGALKTGLAVTVSVSGSKDAAEEDGAAQSEMSFAAVTVDAEGKIVACTIDALQTKITFSKDGKITTAPDTQFQTKNELGDAYGMKKASAIGKEWNEQADAFAAYCVGKTVDEVTVIAMTEGKVDDADLAASCSLYIGGFQAIVAKAVANATESSAQPGDKIGVGVSTSIASSKDATADADGLAQAYTTISAVTTNEEGKITSSVIDAVQANVNFDATGKITSDITAEVPTKNELGDAYGMKKASAIGKEWNEQAAAYAAYTVGKTVDEVNQTAVTEGVPSDTDLAASVTLHIADFNNVIAKAAAAAK